MPHVRLGDKAWARADKVVAAKAQDRDVVFFLDGIEDFDGGMVLVKNAGSSEARAEEYAQAKLDEVDAA